MKTSENVFSFISDVLHRYHPISEESVTALYNTASLQHVKKGELILHIGKKSNKINILQEGVIVSYYLDNEGNQYHKNIFMEGHWVGSMVALIQQTPSNFALQAISEVTLIQWNYSTFRMLVNAHDDLKDFYIAYLEKNWVIDKEKREVDIVMKEAKERYLELLNEHPDIENRVPLQYIASHLGITPTQLSRIRKSSYK
ncbi:Crp/Fnr family transcriptional regulator [Fulvivirga maritima]|uniref:Crp/Fnr family transcriptional regulator n=1 Tax=Fulvivirga maritima TaxID=2904247 RepID=UPI001F24DE5E|nr:Crp/Fnr family transcriptional regulator [Fulvivirga maritima]UII26720.1 Crp/Fnr family transcriptional regulator [Fulvivirga maritima]